MTDPARAYRAAATDLDAHMRDCTICTAGTACPAGDDTAEREFRSWRALERHDPTGASQHPARRGFA